MVKTKEDTKANVSVNPEEPAAQRRSKPFGPEEIDRRVREALALARPQTPKSFLLQNLLNTLKAEDEALAEACDSALSKVKDCFGTSKAVGQKTAALKQSICERHFEAGEELEKMAWLLRGCYDTWRKNEKLPETTAYRARALYTAAKHIDAVKGLTLSQAYKKFGILQPKPRSLNKQLVSLEKHLTRIADSDNIAADKLENDDCAATIKRCLDQLEKLSASIMCSSTVNAAAAVKPSRAKIAAKKSPIVTEQLVP